MITRERDYDNLPGINNSKLKYFKKSPEIYLYRLKNPEPRTPAQTFGIVYHILVYEEHKWKDQVIVMDESQRPVPEKDYKTHANADWKRAQFAAAQQENKALITLEEYDRMRYMRDVYTTNPFIQELLQQHGNQFETPVQWNHRKSLCKGLLDWRNPNFLFDLKTTDDADPDEWIRKSYFPFGYDRQCGMYTDGDLGGKFTSALKLKDFFFGVQEKEAPYPIAIYKQTREVIANGIEEYRTLVEGWQSCIDHGIWEGYEFKAPNNLFFTIDLPYWKRNLND